jgi:hypothetical protein
MQSKNGDFIEKPAETQTSIQLAIYFECLTPHLEDMSLNPI